MLSNRNFEITNATTQVREYNWTISEVLSTPGAMQKPMLVINGQSPGPIVEANLGDQIVVHVYNNMTNQTSMHWHGMHLKGQNWMDGTYSITQCGIPPGGMMTYNWTVQNTGTTWYHAHMGVQYTNGAYGALILHDANETAMLSHPYSDDVTLLLNDMYNTQAEALLWRMQAIGTGIDGQPGDEPAPDGAMINGVSQARCAYLPASNLVIPERKRSLVDRSDTTGTYYPETNYCGNETTEYYNLTLVGNSTYRLRLINSGTLANTIFSIDNHNLTIIEVDGTSVEPVTTGSVNLAVAQRASVLVTLDQEPGAYWIRNVLGDDQIIYTPTDLNLTTLGVLRYSGINESVLPADVPADDNMTETDPFYRFVPADAMDAPAPTVQQTVQFNSQYVADNARWMFFNSSSWQPLSSGEASIFLVDDYASNVTALESNTIGSQLNIVNTNASGVMDLVINNLDDGNHPFHLHGYTFWVMAQGDGHFYGDTSSLNVTNPMRRDTTTISERGYLIIRFLTDNPGVWAFHCHIGWHMENGLLMTITNLPEQVAAFDVPSAIKDLCSVDSKKRR